MERRSFLLGWAGAASLALTPSAMAAGKLHVNCDAEQKLARTLRTAPAHATIDEEVDTTVDTAERSCTAGQYRYATPVHLSALINGPGFEGGPSLSKDGRSLYFVSDRSDGVDPAGADQDIYVTHRPSTQSFNWGPAERVPEPISSPYLDFAPELSRDGLTLYFASNRPGSIPAPPEIFGEGVVFPDIWVSRRETKHSPWGEPEHLESDINTPFFEAPESLSRDGRTLYFDQFLAPPNFDFNIFTATRECDDGPFAPKVLLPPPVNTDTTNDFGAALTKNGKTLFFSSGTDDPFAPDAVIDLFVTERLHEDAPWGPPVAIDTINCPSCFQGLTTMYKDGQQICWMGRRDDTFGDLDIYCAVRK
jgi:hypothetical protein